MFVTPNRQEDTMHTYPNQRRSNSILDYLLYALAGTALVAMSYSFLLWLRF